MPTGFAERLFLALPAFRNVGATIFGLTLNRERYGGHYHDAVERILEREAWTSRQILEYQAHRLRRIVEIAFRHVPYYRETSRRLGLSPHDFDSADDLRKLPILEKEAVRADPLRFLDDRLDPSQLTVETTTGTTGTPIRVFMPRSARQEHFAFFEARCRRAAGLRYGEDSHVTFGVKRVVPVERTEPPFWCYNYAGKQLYMSVFHLADPYLGAYCGELRRRPYRAMIGYGSAISAVARYMLHQNIRDIRIPVAITSGETLLPRQRDQIQRAFGCRVFDQYGCTELSVFAAERPCGRMHLSPDYSVVEFVDDEGRPLPPGRTGHVLGTSLLNDAQILLRYRVGDMASLAANPCACGSPLPVLESVEGRSTNAVVLPDGRRLYRFAGLDSEIPSVQQSQIVQEAIGVFTIYVVATKDFGETEAARLAASLETSVGPAKIGVQVVDSISRGPGRKSAAIISRVAEPEISRPSPAAADPENMTVIVQSERGLRHFEVTRGTKVADLESAALDAFEMVSRDRCLLAPATSPGTALLPERTLDSYGLRNGTTLVLTTVGAVSGAGAFACQPGSQKRGGQAKAPAAHPDAPPAGYRPESPGNPRADHTPAPGETKSL
jgi:phenylacetate-CoA ligase